MRHRFKFALNRTAFWGVTVCGDIVYIRHFWLSVVGLAVIISHTQWASIEPAF